MSAGSIISRRLFVTLYQRGHCPGQHGNLIDYRGVIQALPIRIFLFPTLGLLSLWRWDLAFYRKSDAVGARLEYRVSISHRSKVREGNEEMEGSWLCEERMEEGSMFQLLNLKERFAVPLPSSRHRIAPMSSQ